jgi:uncharacterized protein YuzE
MKVRYDPKVDAAYISFREGPAEVTTVRLSEDVSVDFGPGEEVYGIEVLSASQHLGIRQDSPSISLENLKAQTV